MNTLTVERLLEVLSPRDNPQITTGARMPKYIYQVRKQILDKRFSHTINILRANHWDKLSEYLTDISRNTTPITLMARLRKMELSGVAERKLDLVYTYLIDLYVVIQYLRMIESRVENSIDYEDPVYD